MVTKKVKTETNSLNIYHARHIIRYIILHRKLLFILRHILSYSVILIYFTNLLIYLFFISLFYFFSPSLYYLICLHNSEF